MNDEKHIPSWRTVSTKVLADNTYLRLEEAHREEAGTGQSANFYIVEAPDWVNIIALTEKNEVVLIEQFRQGTERIELEIPSGIIDKNEAPAEAALRELLEETGYGRSEKSEFKKIGEVVTNPAFMRNRNHTYLLTNARLTGSVHFDELETIAVRLVPRSVIEHLISSGAIRHALVVAAFYWLGRSGK